MGIQKIRGNIEDKIYAIKAVYKGTKVTLRYAGEVGEAIALGAGIFEMWFLPYYFRNNFNHILIYLGYLAAGVITFRGLILLARYMRRIGEQQSTTYKAGEARK